MDAPVNEKTQSPGPAAALSALIAHRAPRLPTYTRQARQCSRRICPWRSRTRRWRS